MEKEEAIQYLIDFTEYVDEWTGTGMWEAVEKVMKTPKKDLTKDFLQILLKEAANR